MVIFFLICCEVYLFCYLYWLWKQKVKRKSESYHPTKAKGKQKNDEVELHGTHRTKAKQNEDVKIEIDVMLTQEMIMDILTRLPVKSLIRFSALSKGFNNLFKSSNFIAEHLQFSNQSPSLFLHGNDSAGYAIGVRYWSTLHLLPSISHSPSDSPTKITHLVDKPFPISDYAIQIEGSSNGLLCLTAGNARFVSPSILIWNPATRQVKRLPNPSSAVTSSTWLSFGFTSVVNDYKVVLVDDITRGVEVYSLKTGSWTQFDIIASGLQLHHVSVCSYLIEELVTTNGSTFGVVKEIKRESEADEHLDLVTKIRNKLNAIYPEWIICFSLGTETFTKINMPDLPPHDWGKLAPYGDSIALLVKSKFMDDIVDLWVHDRSGDYWTKLYSVTPFSPDKPQRLLNVWRDQVVIAMRESDEEVLICTSNGVENKILATLKAQPTFSFLNAYDYVESLVLI